MRVANGRAEVVFVGAILADSFGDVLDEQPPRRPQGTRKRTNEAVGRRSSQRDPSLDPALTAQVGALVVAMGVDGATEPALTGAKRLATFLKHTGQTLLLPSLLLHPLNLKLRYLSTPVVCSGRRLNCKMLNDVLRK